MGGLVLWRVKDMPPRVRAREENNRLRGDYSLTGCNHPPFFLIIPCTKQVIFTQNFGGGYETWNWG